MLNRQNFTGYVLAGGKSSRMKRDKAFLEFGGKTFLQKAFETLAPSCQTVKVVLNTQQKHFIKKLSGKNEFIFDVYENRGAVGGIHAALSDCETQFAVILPVDLPNVTSAAISKLCETALREREFAAIVPRQIDGRLQPLCAVYQAGNCLTKLLETLLKNERVSARDFIALIETKIIDAKFLSTEKKLFANINAPEDFTEINSQLD